MVETSDKRFTERPIVGVGGVVIKDDRILLVRRKKDPGKGLWSIPGGVVEAGERLEDAVRREMLEETGLQVEPVRPIHVTEVIEGKRPKYHYVIIDYLCRVVGGRLRPGGDAKEVRWFRMEELNDARVTRTTRELLDKLRSPFFLVIRNRDVKRVLIGTPRGHEHIRTIFELKDGSLIVFQEATMENVARAIVEVEMHPTRRAISLAGVELERRKEGYNKYQLIEEDRDDESIIDEITDLLVGNSD